MQITKTIKLYALAVLVAVVLAACNGVTENLAFNRDIPSSSPSEALANCRIIQHLKGETKVCDQPHRIVVLSPSNLELLLALGAQPAGFADYTVWHRSEYDNPTRQIPYLGSRITSQPANLGLDSEPSIEAIFNVQPDLIVGTGDNASQYETLSNIAPTLLLSRNVDDIEVSLRALAQALDRLERAEQLITETNQQIVVARETFVPVVTAHSKMLLLGAIQLKELYLGDSNYGLCGSLLEELGFQLVKPPELENSKPDAAVPISLETLSKLNVADSVIMFAGNLNEFNSDNNFEDHQIEHIKQAWEQDAIAQSLDDSKAGRVYFIPAYLC